MKFTALIAVLYLSPALALAAVVTVQKVDDTLVRGNLASIQNGQLTIEVKPDKKPVVPTTLPFGDISRIVFREPVLKASQAEREEPEATQTTVLGGIFQAIFGSSDDAPSPPPQPEAAPTPPTSRPGNQIVWTVTASGGDLLHGHITEWSGQKVALQLLSPLNQTVEISTGRLLTLWCGSDDDQKKARALGATPGAQDAAFVEKDNAVVKVEGTILGISGDSLRFQYGGAERKIALARLVGLVIGSAQLEKPRDALRQSIRLDSQDVLTGALSGVDDKAVAFTTPIGQTIRFPVGNIYSVEFLNGRLVYLSDLSPAKVTQTAYFGRVIPYRTDAGLEGGALQLSDGKYARGIAMHSRCILDYNIHGDFQRFRARLGFEQPGGKLGRADVRLVADGVILYQNPDARGDEKPVDIDLDITGRQTLSLQVDFGKDQDVGDRVIWANARLLKAK